MGKRVFTDAQGRTHDNPLAAVFASLAVDDLDDSDDEQDTDDRHGGNND